jgi:hypothetical protein
LDWQEAIGRAAAAARRADAQTGYDQSVVMYAI